jgi:antitoxin ParD1/3/4
MIMERDKRQAVPDKLADEQKASEVLDMNVSLTPELDEFVNTKVSSGLYTSASEVIREGLRLLREQDELKRFRLEELKREIKKGIDSLDRGEGRPFDAEAIKAKGRAKLAQRKK